MKKFSLTSLFMMLCATGIMAQSFPSHEMYVKDGKPENIVTALDNWEPGKPWNGDASYVDENFWISRVPLKDRFRPGDYANDALDDSNNKKFCWMAPTGEMSKKWGALPRYNFDADNFNMWQYLDIHSNWTNGFWRVPGAFNDVAHKNGVKTGCTYFIDWGAAVNDNTEPGKTLYELATPGTNSYGDSYKYSRKLIQFLKYYGIDGLCFNPEGYWGYTVYSRFIPFLAECHKIAKELDHPFHVDWYAYVSNYGQLSDNGCKLTTANNNWFHNTSYNEPVTDVFFLNYNWSESGLQQSVQTAKDMGRSSFDVYAGYDMQGRGYGTYGNAGWEVVMKYPVSLVIWGAHDRNQLYISSTEGGQSDYAVQNEYQKKQEMLFSGGNRNVLNLPALNNGVVTSSFSDLQKWHGYAKAVIERSTLDEVPFVTRFNLGNGRFFNNEGVTTWEHKWYNYGVQDLLPTWRWWVDKGDGKTVPADAVNLDFTYDDAWFAGSCLKVHGATTRSDVRLFATKWNVASGDDEFRLIFKPKNGGATNLELMVAKQDGENSFVYVPVEGDIKGGEWNEVVIKASDAGLVAGDVIGCVGLSVKNTDAAFEVLLGEFAFVPANFSEQPATPTITHAEVMKRFYNRADIKVVFNMPAPASRKAEYDGCPVYNEEVGTWYYEIYVKQQNQETLLTTTTSWAAYVVDATLIPMVESLQIGVRAVGKDGRAKSEIVWSQVIEEPLTMIETLTVDKSVIKPNEVFTIGFEDPNHPVADIKIYDAMTGTLKASENGVLTMTTALPAVGSYDVEVTTNGKTVMNRSLILVSPEETGRMPEITSLEADKENMENGNVTYNAAINRGDTYNGAPCTVSQALYMCEPYQFTVDAAIMSEYTNTSFALWFKVEKFEHAALGTLLMTKVNRNYPNGGWTTQVWGEMWTAIRPTGYGDGGNLKKAVTTENELSLNTDAPDAGTAKYEHNEDPDIMSDGYSLMPGVWYHVCAVKSGKDLKLYLNGKEIASGTARGVGPKNWDGAKFYVGGSMTNLASLTGWVDEVQIWSKALTEAEVQEAMKGYKTAPANLEGYFTFEESKTDSEGYVYFTNTGKNSSAVPGGYMTTGKNESGVTTDYKQNQFTTTLGVPMLTGVFPVKYESSKWYVENAKLNTTTETTAEAAYGECDGDYEVKLVATNSWGSATKTITEYIVVTGIDEMAESESGYMIYPKPFEGVANVLFAQGGIYEVAVFAADGKLVAKEAMEVSDSEVREISMAEMGTGTYVVVISKNGKAVRSFKIVM